MSDRDIWNDPDWTVRRQECRRRARWYEGLPLDKTNEKRNRETGELVKKFPLRINLVKLSCDVHRDLARGIPDRGDPLIVRAAVERSDGVAEQAELLETTLNDKLWRPSHGAAIQQEALLAMNIYDGVVLKLSWEPWDTDLPYRLAVRLIKNPSFIKPVWDPQNPWRMLECYYGFEISPGVAKIKYGITPRQDDISVLYMEHWTKKEWSISVDERTPTMKWDNHTWQLKGENPWGIVPFYYIPHERSTKLFGDSQVDGQEELNKDVNSKLTVISDTVKASWPGLLWGHDLDRSLSVRKIVLDGQVIAYVVDTGRTRNVQGAQPPSLDAIPTPDIPESIASFPQDLLNFWMMIERISPATFGMDDTQSGRITGPVVANRMWTSMAHSTTECINFSTGKTILDSDALRILVEREGSGTFTELGIESPGITVDASSAQITQNWPPMIPADRGAKHSEFIERLQQHGISLEKYLSAMKEDDVAGEMVRIEAGMRLEAEIEALSRPIAKESESEPGNQNDDS